MGVSSSRRVLGTTVPRASSLAFLAVVVGLASAGAAAAQPAPPSHGKVELLAREAALEGGRTGMLGILFDLQPGWHIYWVNPGDAVKGDQIDNASPQAVAPTGRDGLRLTLKKSSLLEKPVSVLKGLLVLGPDRAFEIAAPVSAQR